MPLPHDLETLGQDMHQLAEQLFPICRSMTGPGVRETLGILGRRVPLEIHEVPSGEQALDWEIPREWRIRDAYVKDHTGTRVIDFHKSNLHVVNGSAPVRGTMTWSELRDHLFTLPDHPDWVPYRTTFFEDSWGFCLPHRLYQQLQQREQQGPQSYEVCIDAEQIDGSLTYGELVLPGDTDDEVLISTHVCHPSLANDNLSGIAVATFLAEQVRGWNRRYTYRFLFVPATIGAISWLSRNRKGVRRIKHGLVLAGLGDSRTLTYRRSRRGAAEIDRAVERVLFDSIDEYRVLDFEPFGYDQRQFCSPGFDLPVGCLMRSLHGEYPEYHTSADDLELIRPDYLADSLEKCASALQILEQNRCYQNLRPYGEPHLKRHGLHQGFGREQHDALLQRAMMWVLNLSDGQTSLLDIAERSRMPFDRIRQAADALVESRLLAPCDTSLCPAPLTTVPATPEFTLNCV